jgi:hypothetical protein
VLSALFAILLLLAACGGGEGGDTTVAPDDATDTTSEDDGPTVGLDEIPQECIDAFGDYLREIEAIVEPIDWENATMEEMEEVGTALDPATTQFEEATADSGCEDINVDATDEESFDFMIELARDEAPGTVAYLEMIRGMVGEFGEEADIPVAGDCETDIATLQALIDEGGTMQDRTFPEIAAIGNLVTSITTNCDQDRALEFMGAEDVTNFMRG